MIVEVKMLAFEDEGVVRRVEVPDAEVKGLDTLDLLERVFYYGQNDFQPQQCCSVSAGDVVVLGDTYWICQAAGWSQITAEQLAYYEKLDRRERHFSEYVYPRED